MYLVLNFVTIAMCVRLCSLDDAALQSHMPDSLSYKYRYNSCFEAIVRRNMYI